MRTHLKSLVTPGLGALAHAALPTSLLIKALFPTLFGQPSCRVVAAETDGDAVSSVSSRPLRLGVVLSGGQAPGGHNVIAGLYDFCQTVKGGALLGFCDGPKGIMTGRHIQLDDARVDRYRNQGGFDIIGSGRDKIHSDRQFADSLRHCEALRLDGLVVIGGRVAVAVRLVARAVRLVPGKVCASGCASSRSATGSMM